MTQPQQQTVTKEKKKEVRKAQAKRASRASPPYEQKAKRHLAFPRFLFGIAYKDNPSSNEMVAYFMGNVS